MFLFTNQLSRDLACGGRGNDSFVYTSHIWIEADPIRPKYLKPDVIAGGPGQDAAEISGRDFVPDPATGREALSPVSLTVEGTEIQTFAGRPLATLSGIERLTLMSPPDGAPVIDTDLPLKYLRSAGDAEITLTSGTSAVIVTGSGDDTIVSAGDDGRLLRDLDGDIVVAGLGDDRVTTGPGDDLIYAGLGADRIDTGAGDDRIILADVVFNQDHALPTARALLPEPGTLAVMEVAGGPREDWLDFSHFAWPGASGPDLRSGILLDLRVSVAYADRNTKRDAFVVGEIENVRGSPRDDRLEASFFGGTLIGNGGDDTLIGDAGDDSLIGGRGARSDRSEEDGANMLRGGPGFDTLVGGNGPDTLHGGDQRDRLIGGAGDDVLIGSFGRDRIEGGPGNDRMTGGGAADRFVFTPVSSREGADINPVDRIPDFNLAQGDRLIFSGGIASSDLAVREAGGTAIITDTLSLTGWSLRLPGVSATEIEAHLGLG